jgi:hypothetical protein
MEAQSRESRRCTAHSSRSGEPCKRWAILGGTVCATHGGRAPAVKAAAIERLKALQDPAIVALGDALEADRVYVVDGSVEHDADYPTRLRAATAVLDRTGLGPTSKQEVSLEASDQLAQVLTALDG